MSTKANPKLIGAFFALGMALSVAGLAMFGSRGLFHPRQTEVLYFNASLKGLNPGAPVKFRGVTIGSVVEVLIRHNQSNDDFSMPVLISIDKKIAQAKSDQWLGIGSRAKLDYLIQQGFRGSLDAESLVTGVLYIGLDFVPNAPPPVFHQISPKYHEIPTMPSQIQQLLANLAQVDVRGLTEKLSGAMTRLDTSLGKVDFAEINAGVTNLLEAANRLVTTPDLTNSLAGLKRTLDSAQALLTRIDGRVDPLADSLTNTLNDAQKTMAGLRVAVGNVADLLGPESAMSTDLPQTLEDLGNAGRAVADLAEFLKRNPNTLLAGRKRPKEQP